MTGAGVVADAADACPTGVDEFGVLDANKCLAGFPTRDPLNTVRP